MPGHVDLIIQIKASGMHCLKYDTLGRQKWEKRMARGSRKVKSLASTDMVLYIVCLPPRMLQKLVGPSSSARDPLWGSQLYKPLTNIHPPAQQTQWPQLQVPTQCGNQIQ